jgi:hypothetical protein
MSYRLLEQRIDIKFCVILGKNASDTCAIFSEACVGEATEKSSGFEWYKRFKEGRDNEVDERSARPRSHRTDEDVENIRNLVHSDRRSSVRATAVQLNLDK